MRLLNVYTLQLELFESGSVPAYAILSHRWEEEEVEFSNIANGSAKCLRGYPKIIQCCARAKDTGFCYVWIDTCCIDKTSSAELSEAINSMYRWYEVAAVCYVYLSDVTEASKGQFLQSKWFTRGWTLQELLAPRDVIFFQSEWEALGNKKDLCSCICEATGIPRSAVLGFKPNEYSVAERMAWAAHRCTTRTEDRAYSLLGVFGINMPMLYGEREKAFIKLQEEIMKASSDHSIFAFGGAADPTFGLLAATPASFSTSKNVIRGLHHHRKVQPEGFTFSNAGVSITLKLYPWFLDGYVALLGNCVRQTQQSSFIEQHEENEESERNDRDAAIGIVLKRSYESGQYRRVALDGQSLFDFNVGDLQKASWYGQGRTVLISRSSLEEISTMTLDYGFRIEHISPFVSNLFKDDKTGRRNKKRKPDTRIHLVGRKMNKSYELTIPMGVTGIVGMIQLQAGMSKTIMLHFTFDFDFNPVCLISRPDASRNTNKLQDLMIRNELSSPTVPRAYISVAEDFAICQLIHNIQEQSDYRPILEEDDLQLLEPKRPSGWCPISNNVAIRFRRNEIGYSVEITDEGAYLARATGRAPEIPAWERWAWKSSSTLR